jgi:hypothetical protein
MQIINENITTAIVDKLTSKESLLDIMIDCEDYLDQANVYAFENWDKGVLVHGPEVKKYWVNVIFKYPYREMPDPQGGLRLLPHGTKVRYKKAWEKYPAPIKSPDDYEPGTKRPRMKKRKIWLLCLSIPRRFVEAVNQDMFDQYDAEINDVQNAEDQLAVGSTL